MTFALHSRLAKMEASSSIGEARNITLVGGDPTGIPEFLAGLGVCQMPGDTITHIERAGEMSLQATDDWALLLAYVAKYAPSRGIG